MKRSIWMCALAFVAACAVPSSETASDEASSSEQLAPAPAGVSTGPTAEDAALIAAAATGNPDLMARAAAATAAACHGVVTCPGFQSCGTWSTAAACGSRFCVGQCGKTCTDPDCVPRFRLDQLFESFRVCTDANLNQCVEWGVSEGFAGCSFSC